MKTTYTYYPEPGISYDISKMLFVKLNPVNIWQEVLTSTDTTKEQIESIKTYADSLPDAKEEVSIFVFIPTDKKTTFLSMVISKLIASDFKNYSIATLKEYFADFHQAKLDLLTYYFGEHDYSDIDYDYTIRQNKKIPERIKIMLWGINVYPQKYISFLVQAIDSYHTYISDSNSTIDVKNIDFDPMVKKIFEKHYIANSSSFLPTHFDFSLSFTTPIFLYHNFRLPTPYFITTLYTVTRKQPPLQFSPSLNHFLELVNAVGDKSRISILSLLIKNGSLSLSDIAQKLNLPLTAIKYHISVLKKSGIVISNRSYQNSIYSFNPSGFKNIKESLNYLEKGEELL